MTQKKDKKDKYDHLLSKEKSGWLNVKKEDNKLIEEISKAYINFLDQIKTEREAVDFIAGFALENDYIDLKDFLKLDSNLQGKKIVFTNKGKNIILAIIGKKPLEKGINIICSHIDSPRLDLKQSPLYEDSNLAFLKTHYYGGIKKFHWLNIPLAIHGKVITIDGKNIDIKIGNDDNDPIFIIPDLLPHLSKKVSSKKVSEAFPAENLNLIIGNIPINDKEKEGVKINILNILNKKYGIKEDDFNSAELEIVPAMRPKEAGLDRSFIAGYGQDDRISSYCAFKAIMATSQPKRTSVILLIDKEEIGSEGNSSVQSKFLELFLSEIIEKLNGSYNEKMLKKCLYNSYGLSSDVDVGYDPNYKDVFDKRNTAKMGNGIVLTKYTGHGGKYGASDANAEYVGKIRKLFKDNNIIFQFGSLGKIDEGGGGTISKFLANYGMEVLDAGPPILGMHSPYELSSKFDLYQTFCALKIFLQKA